MDCSTAEEGRCACASVLGEPGRLSPPIWPCTTRGFPCLVCCQTSGGLLPHLFTLAKLSERFEDVPQVFLRDATVLLSAGGIFSVALSVSVHVCSAGLLDRHLQASTAPWRYQARCPISSPALASLRRRCPDFPPAQPSCDRTKPAITRLTRQLHYNPWGTGCDLTRSGKRLWLSWLNAAALVVFGEQA